MRFCLLPPRKIFWNDDLQSVRTLLRIALAAYAMCVEKKIWRARWSSEWPQRIEMKLVKLNIRSLKTRQFFRFLLSAPDRRKFVQMWFKKKLNEWVKEILKKEKHDAQANLFNFSCSHARSFVRSLVSASARFCSREMLIYLLVHGLNLCARVWARSFQRERPAREMKLSHLPIGLMGARVQILNNVARSQ